MKNHPANKVITATTDSPSRSVKSRRAAPMRTRKSAKSDSAAKSKRGTTAAEGTGKGKPSTALVPEPDLRSFLSALPEADADPSRLLELASDQVGVGKDAHLRANGYRVQVGGRLLQARPPHGDVAEWEAAEAKKYKVAPRTIRSWVRAAEDVRDFGNTLPKSVIGSLRGLSAAAENLRAGRPWDHREAMIAKKETPLERIVTLAANLNIDEQAALVAAVQGFIAQAQAVAAVQPKTVAANVPQDVSTTVQAGAGALEVPPVEAKSEPADHEKASQPAKEPPQEQGAEIVEDILAGFGLSDELPPARMTEPVAESHPPARRKRPRKPSPEPVNGTKSTSENDELRRQIEEDIQPFLHLFQR